ncbi:hypothetical protein [Shimia ponticola]|uniref:hypothetical protein n=1 Tax=Shimia ponticola TaxID=2582893 RepID=UPI0011BE592B|nr:hypothetical protein [Shimia ponticola]
MTALKEFERLETVGLWRSGPEAQRREVGVSFGKATLVLSDSAGQALTHWSLAAVHRVNPGNLPALFSPDGTEAETIELADTDMIDAIEKVQRSIDRARPRPGRLRWLLLTASFATVGYLGLWWLPDALVNHATTVVPQVKRADIGQELQTRVIRLTGQPCAEPFGAVALSKLNARILPSGDHTLLVLRSGPETTRVLPGGTIAMGRKTIEDHDDPAVPAGYAIAAAASAASNDPLRQMLEATGTWSTVQLLTTGQIASETLDAYAEYLLLRSDPPASTAALLETFKTAEVSSRPYALAKDVTGETTLDLIEADPFYETQTTPLLSDGEWISLQGICETE